MVRFELVWKNGPEKVKALCEELRKKVKLDVPAFLTSRVHWDLSAKTGYNLRNAKYDQITDSEQVVRTKDEKEH